MSTACAKHGVLAGVRLDVDAERAEEQELEKGGLADTLKEIVGRTMPSPRYVRFHEAHVQRYLSRLKAFPPRCSSPCALIWQSADASVWGAPGVQGCHRILSLYDLNGLICWTVPPGGMCAKPKLRMASKVTAAL